MIILEENLNEQASIDSKVLEAEGSALPATVLPDTAPPPYFPQPPPNTGSLPVAAQNLEPVLSHPGPPNNRQQSATRRFVKAFAYALLVIALMRTFIWSVDLVSLPGSEPHEWTGHRPYDAGRLSMQFTKPDESGCGFGTTHPRCPPHSGPPPRRIRPSRYPPPASPDSRSKPEKST